MRDNALVIQIGGRLDRLIGYTGAALHEGVEQITERIIVTLNSAGAEHITCDRNKAVGRPGQIDLQTVLAVVDVIHGLIVGKVGTEFEEAAQSGTGGRAFKICCAEDTEY